MLGKSTINPEFTQITLKEFIQSERCSLYSGLLLALLYGMFGYVHFVNFLETNEIILLLVMLSEAMVLILFIIREKPRTVSVNILDWTIAILGSTVPLFFRPSDFGILTAAALPLTVLGILLQIGSVISLNTSYAIVPANRIIKTTLLYSFIRHPLYASYFLTLTGYVLNFTSIYNIGIFIVSMILFYMRIIREENHLLIDPEYAKYASTVRYRIIPFVF